MSKQANAADVGKGVNKGMLAMRAANAAKAAERAAAWAALTPEEREARKAAAATMRAQAHTREKRVADKRADVHRQASISVAVHWQVCLGWREGGSDSVTVQRVSVEAPAGAVRRAAKAARAQAKAPSKGARFAGVLAVLREDAIALLA